MFDEQILEKNSTNQLKRFIALLLAIVMFIFPAVPIFAASDKPTHRQLAMFASICYVNLEQKNYKTPDKLSLKELTNLKFSEKKMLTDSEFKNLKINTMGLDKDTNANTFLFNGMANISEVKDWKVVNYIKADTKDLLRIDGQFVAMTFKKDNNVVIAFRGTDFDIGDAVDDLMYGLVGVSGQEKWAEEYALAVAKKYPKAKIYITGWSLGGYLAQFAGAKLLNNNNYKGNVKEIVYFNGIGTSFWVNIKNKTSKLPVIGKKLSNMLKDVTLQKNQEAVYNTLKNNSSKVVSYEVDGDIISNLGRHAGTRKKYSAHAKNVIEYANQENPGTRAIASIALFSNFTAKDLNSYVWKYRPNSGFKYFMATHLMGNFFGVLPYAEGTLPAHIISMEFSSVPGTLKKGKTDEIYLTVKTTRKLTTKKLATTSFGVSNTSKLEIVSVGNPTESGKAGNYTYKYTIKVKGKATSGKSSIMLKTGVLKIDGVQNYRVVSNQINTRK